MFRQTTVAALSALTIVAGLKVTASAADFDGPHDCNAAPKDAVLSLPFPLNKWAQVICTPLGHMVSSHEGWVWVMPDASGTVLIPAQQTEGTPEAVGDKAYFTKIDVAQVKGQEFEQAYSSFHVGFDQKEVKPDAYRVDLTTSSGKTMRMFFFDYDTYAWGMSCPEDKCEADTRFVILDKEQQPKPRQPSI